MTVRDLRDVFGSLIQIVVRQPIIIPGICHDDEQLYFGVFGSLENDKVLDMKVDCCCVSCSGRFNHPTLHIGVETRDYM